jgi:hypothetical protein
MAEWVGRTPLEFTSHITRAQTLAPGIRPDRQRQEETGTARCFDFDHVVRKGLFRLIAEASLR